MRCARRNNRAHHRCRSRPPRRANMSSPSPAPPCRTTASATRLFQGQPSIITVPARSIRSSSADRAWAMAAAEVVFRCPFRPPPTDRPVDHRVPSRFQGNRTLSSIAETCVKSRVRRSAPARARPCVLAGLVRLIATPFLGGHLYGHFCWKGRHTARGHTMVARKHNHLRRADLRLRISAPTGIPDRHIFQPAQRARRFGQLTITRLGAIGSLGIRTWARSKQDTKIFKAGKTGHLPPHCIGSGRGV